MGRIAQSVAMVFVRGCFVSGVVSLYVLAVAIKFFFVPLARMSRTPGSDGTEIFLPFALGAFFLLVLPALVAYFAARQRNARFDAIFGSLGLAGFPYALQYRRYDGTYGGRRLQAFFSRGPRVVLEADTAVSTRFGITAGSGDTKLLAGLTGERPIRFAIPAFDGLVVYGKEEQWVRRLLAEPGVPALLSRLLRYDGPLARRQVVLRPGALMLTFQFSTAVLSWIPSPAQARDWAEALVALAAIAESVPPPTVPIAPTRLEQQVGSIRGVGVSLNPGAVALVAMLATVLLIGAFAGVMVVAGKSCRPGRGPGSLSEALEVLGHVYATVHSLQVVELKAVDMLDLYGIQGHLGTVERQDETTLHALARVPPGARIVIAKDPRTGAAREVEWVFATPLAIRLSIVEKQVGKLEVSRAPDDPRAVIGLASQKPREGARWPVRVRIRFEGKAGGPITRIAAYRERTATPPPGPSSAGAAQAASPEASPAAASVLLSPCPIAFEVAGDVPVGESRSCVCLDNYTTGAVVGSGRYAPRSRICSAARHAGVLTKPGGAVTFWRQPDCPRLWGSEGNGVVSHHEGDPTATFSFTAEPPPCPPAPSSSADLEPCPTAYSRELEAMPEGTSFDCTCKWSKRERGSVWGRDIYAIRSDVCNAAQQVGAVERPGSTVTVFLGGTCSYFVGTSTPLGFVKSSRWDKPERTFAFRLPYPPCASGRAPTKTGP